MNVPQVVDANLRAFLMEERRITKDRLATLERALGIEVKETAKERALEKKIAELEAILAEQAQPVLR